VDVDANQQVDLSCPACSGHASYVFGTQRRCIKCGSSWDPKVGADSLNVGEMLLFDIRRRIDSPNCSSAHRAILMATLDRLETKQG
jgi:hypothetical protein